MEKLILIGAGGHAKSIIDSIDTNKYELVGFIDQSSEEKSCMELPIIAHDLEELENKEDYTYFVAIGNNEIRKNWYNKLKENNLKVATIIDKTAIIAKTAVVGEGTFVGKLAIINSEAVVGNNTIVNTKALIEHCCKVGSHVHISTNSVLNGDVEVGEGTFVGSSSVIIPQHKIGKWATVGAGAAVIHDVDDYTTVVGVPAKPLIKEK